MAVAVGVSDLLASAFTSTLGSSVVTYEQYKKEEEEKKHEAYFQALDIDHLFVASQLHGKVGGRQDAASSVFEVYIKPLTGEDFDHRSS